MSLTLLLVLVGAVAADAVGPSPLAATRTEAFRQEPLALWKPVSRTGQWLRLPTPPNPTKAEVPPLENRRTGVTCTLRILAAKPEVDPGMVMPVLGSHSDAIVRSSLSPCVE